MIITDNQQDPFLHQLIDSLGSKNAGEYNRVDYNDNSVLYQFPLLGMQIGDIAELFNCGVGKRSNKFAQSALKQSNCIVYFVAQNVLFYI